MAFRVESLRASLQGDLAAQRADWRVQGQPLWTALSRSSRHRLRRLIDWLARERVDVYTMFSEENELSIAIADAAEHLGTSEWSLSDLLQRVAEASPGRWVVSVPVVGTLPPLSVRALDDAMVLAPASAWRKNSVSGRDIRRDVADLVSAPAEIGSRYVHGDDDELIDTRRTATLVSTLSGTIGRCREIAFEQCRLLLAGWTLFSPPETELYTPMWPQITEWQPQPQMHRREAAYRIETDGTSERRAGMTVHHPADEASLWAWPDDSVLLRVLRALRAAGRSRAAAALLTAAWDLYLAARNPSDAPWIERLTHVMHAREALCEDPRGDGRTIEGRFQALCRELSVVDAVRRRGWGAHEVHLVGGELQRLRNIATHSSDVVRLRLGHAPTRERSKLDSSRVAGIYIWAGTSPAYHVMRELTMSLWTQLDASDYDDELFESLFQ